MYCPSFGVRIRIGEDAVQICVDWKGGPGLPDRRQIRQPSLEQPKIGNGIGSNGAGEEPPTEADTLENPFERDVDAMEPPARIASLAHVPGVLKGLRSEVVGRRYGVRAARRRRHRNRLRQRRGRHSTRARGTPRSLSASSIEPRALEGARRQPAHNRPNKLRLPERRGPTVRGKPSKLSRKRLSHAVQEWSTQV